LLTIVLVGAVPVFSQTTQGRRRTRSKSHRSRIRPNIPKPLVPVKPSVPKELPIEIQARPEFLSRPLPKIRRLTKGRWAPSAVDALERVLEYTGEENPDYSPSDPPVVVIGFEDVAVNGHLGEAVFQRMVRKAAFRFNQPFWNRIPLQYGRARIHAGYQGFRKMPEGMWPNDPYFRMYRKGMLRAYRSICEEAGIPACRRWIASLLMNYSERDLRTFSRETLTEELNRPVGYETVGDTPEDPNPERERTGIRLIPEMLELFTQLRLQGLDLWIMSTSNDWTATVFAAPLGVHTSRVVGIRVKVVDGFLMEEPLIPTPTGSGAAEAMTLFVGRTPVLVIASPEDEALLGYGHGARVVIAKESLDAKKAREWRMRGWLIQRSFSPIRAPQRLPGSAPATP